jgi:hypothetical protein
MYRMSIVHNPPLGWGGGWGSEGGVEEGGGYDPRILAIFLHYMQVRNRSDRWAFYSLLPANGDTRYSTHT